jgi:diguanylate cyclase (GGDEF)-like protein
MLNTPSIVFDNHHKVADINNAAAKLLNKSISDCLGLHFNDLTFLDITNNIDNLNNKEILLENNYYKIIVSPVMDSNNKSIGYAILLNNITDHKMYLNEIEAQTFNDSITGLYNRTYFEKKLNFENTFKSIAIIIMDLNGLKIINDGFGHSKGDMILKEFATILLNVFNDCQNIIRLGGDEFVVIIENIKENEVKLRLNNLDDICKKHESHLISVSYGYSLMDTNKQTLFEGLEEADINMYKQKLKRSKKFHKIIIEDFWELLIKKLPYIKDKSSTCGKLAVTFGQYLKLNRYELTKLDDISLIYEIGLVSLLLGNDNVLLNNNDKINNQSMIINGYNILNSSKVYSHLATILLHSKESWDGSGYPYGLIKEEIPYLSRILSLIKFCEKIILQNKDENKIIKILRKESGKKFDPILIAQLIEFIEMGNLKNFNEYKSITTIHFL